MLLIHGCCTLAARSLSRTSVWHSTRICVTTSLSLTIWPPLGYFARLTHGLWPNRDFSILYWPLDNIQWICIRISVRCKYQHRPELSNRASIIGFPYSTLCDPYDMNSMYYIPQISCPLFTLRFGEISGCYSNNTPSSHCSAINYLLIDFNRQTIKRKAQDLALVQLTTEFQWIARENSIYRNSSLCCIHKLLPKRVHKIESAFTRGTKELDQNQMAEGVGRQGDCLLNLAFLSGAAAPFSWLSQFHLVFRTRTWTRTGRESFHQTRSTVGKSPV